MAGRGVPFEELTTGDLNAFLFKLVDVQDIDEYYIKAFLGSSVGTGRWGGSWSPTESDQKTGRNEETRYSPLPHGGFQDPPIDLTKSPDQETILREVRDASLEQGWHIDDWIPQLFREISSGFDSAASLKVLDEWINSGNADRIRGCCPPSLRSAARVRLQAHRIRFQPIGACSCVKL